MVDFAQMGTVIGARDAIAQVVADGEQTIAQYKAALTTEEMHAGALDHLVDVLMAELKAVDPTNRLLKPTGKRFASGRPQTQVSVLYAAKFDEIGRSKGVRNPEKLRSQAK